MDPAPKIADLNDEVWRVELYRLMNYFEGRGFEPRLTMALCVAIAANIRAGLEEGQSPCWLCGGLGGVAKHYKASEQFEKALFVGHKPTSKTHPVQVCPVCRGGKL